MVPGMQERVAILVHLHVVVRNAVFIKAEPLAICSALLDLILCVVNFMSAAKDLQ